MPLANLIKEYLPKVGIKFLLLYSILFAYYSITTLVRIRMYKNVSTNACVCR